MEERMQPIREAWSTANKVLLVTTIGALTALPAAAATFDVCASCPITTIEEAAVLAHTDDVINILDPVHTEADILLFARVRVQGQGPSRTILQSSETPGGSPGFVLISMSASMDVRDLTIRNGSAGVALFGVDGRVAQLSNVVVRDNLGIGVLAQGNVQITDSWIVNNADTGISFGGTGRLTLSRSTINGNRGGGLTLFGPAELTNVTVSGNSSASYGGGIFADESSGTKLTNCTITGNSALLGGGGLAHTGFFPNSPFPAEIINSVISGNTPEDCIGIPVIPPGASNLASDGSCQGFSIPSGHADLLPLADNGGPTPTHALGRDSDAVNAGDNAICASPAVGGVDQRGVARPQGAACDLGAYELILNRPPDCSAATPSVAEIWPPNHGFVPVDVLGLTDPDGDPLEIQITAIFQDEPVADGGYTPDGGGVGTATALVRAERDGSGDGRVYHIRFTAADGQGGRCSGEVRTGVPHDQGRAGTPVDGGLRFDSTVP